MQVNITPALLSATAPSATPDLAFIAELSNAAQNAKTRVVLFEDTSTPALFEVLESLKGAACESLEKLHPTNIERFDVLTGDAQTVQEITCDPVFAQWALTALALATRGEFHDRADLEADLSETQALLAAKAREVFALQKQLASRTTNGPGAPVYPDLEA